MTLRADLQLPMNGVGFNLRDFDHHQREMNHETGVFPSTKLSTSILCLDRFDKTRIASPKNNSLASEDSISDSEFDTVDSRELLAAKQLRRLRFSKHFVANKRRKLITVAEAIPVPMAQIRSPENRHWMPSTVNSNINQPLSVMRSPGFLIESSDQLQTRLLAIEAGRKLKALHENKFPILTRSLDAMTDQLVQSQETMKSIRNFIVQANEQLEEIKVLKHHQTMK